MALELKHSLMNESSTCMEPGSSRFADLDRSLRPDLVTAGVDGGRGGEDVAATRIRSWRRKPRNAQGDEIPPHGWSFCRWWRRVPSTKVTSSTLSGDRAAINVFADADGLRPTIRAVQVTWPTPSGIRPATSSTTRTAP